MDLTGDDAANVLTGNEGVNVLTGGGGNDTLIGGAGNDQLTGGVGRNTLTGGPGSDCFTITVTNPIMTDTVRDFEPGSDAVVVNGTPPPNELKRSEDTDCGPSH